MKYLISKYQQNIQYLNILMTSFSTSSKYSHHEYFALHQNIHTMNILQKFISNSLLLAPRIVRTFEKTLTVVYIIKFTEEDELKYLIFEHSSGKYFVFNLRESDKRTSAISIVQDKDEFMVMGWKVAKVIPTWVLCFVDWNNLMTSYNIMLSQDIKMVNTTSDIFNADNINVGNNEEVNWRKKEIEGAKIKTADPLYTSDGSSESLSLNMD